MERAREIMNSLVSAHGLPKEELRVVNRSWKEEGTEKRTSNVRWDRAE
jgi:hypothetical protein